MLKRTTVFLLLTVVMSLFSFYGCGGGTATVSWAGIPAENLNQQQLQQMLSDSVSNYKNLNTYKFDMATDTITDVIGGSNPWTTTLNTKIGGATSLASEQTQMKLDMSIAIASESLGQTGEVQSLTYDMYAMTDWLYLKVTITNMGEQWMKVPLSSELKDLLNLNTVDEQMEPLDSPTKVEYLRTEKVDGIDCYVLSISPNADELAQWLSEQDTNSGIMDWQSLVNVSDVFKNFSFLCYIAKDSNLLMRMVIDMVLEYTAAQAGDSSSDYDTRTINLKMDMKLYDHNKPYSLTLPDEAAGAKEVSEDIFFN